MYIYIHTYIYIYTYTYTYVYIHMRKLNFEQGIKFNQTKKNGLHHLPLGDFFPRYIKVANNHMKYHSCIWNIPSFLLPIGSMYGIYANIWGILMVHVTIYSIHGSYGL